MSDINEELDKLEKEMDLAENLTDEEILVLTKVRHIREHLQAYIDMDEIIQYIVELVEGSNYFSFTSTRAKKYINKKNPTIYLKINDIDEVRKICKLDFRSFDSKNDYEPTDAELDAVSILLQKDIFSKFVDKLSDLIFESDKLQNIFKENELYLSDRVKEIFKQTENFTLTSIFYTLINLKDNIIQANFLS